MSLVTLGLLGYGPFKHLKTSVAHHPRPFGIVAALALVLALTLGGAAAVHEVMRVHAQAACQCSLP